MLCSGKCLCNKDRKCFPTLMTTVALYGGLNHIFLFRFLAVVVFALVSIGIVGISFRAYFPAFFSASLYGLIEFLSISSLADNCDNLNSIDFGSCLIMYGGLLDSMLT